MNPFTFEGKIRRTAGGAPRYPFSKGGRFVSDVALPTMAQTELPSSAPIFQSIDPAFISMNTGKANTWKN